MFKLLVLLEKLWQNTISLTVYDKTKKNSNILFRHPASFNTMIGTCKVLYPTELNIWTKFNLIQQVYLDDNGTLKLTCHHINGRHICLKIKSIYVVRGARLKARGRWFDSRRKHTLSFWIFRLYPVDNSSAKTMQMKSSMTFIERNGCTEIDLILKQIWRRFIWWQVSFNIQIRIEFELYIPSK